MAIHSSILAWRVPGTEEPGGLQLLGLQSQTRLSDLNFSPFHLLVWASKFSKVIWPLTLSPGFLVSLSLEGTSLFSISCQLPPQVDLLIKKLEMGSNINSSTNR